MSTSPLTALCWRAAELVLKHGFKNKKEVKTRKGEKTKMELNLETQPTNGKANGHFVLTKKNRPLSIHNGHINIFDPNKYMLKLPKSKKVMMDNGMVKWEKTE